MIADCWFRVCVKTDLVGLLVVAMGNLVHCIGGSVGFSFLAD